MIVIPMFLAVPSTIFMAGSMLVQFRSGSLISAISCTDAPRKGKLRWLSPCDIVNMHARRDSYDARRIIASCIVAGGHCCRTPIGKHASLACAKQQPEITELPLGAHIFLRMKGTIP